MSTKLTFEDEPSVKQVVYTWGAKASAADFAGEQNTPVTGHRNADWLTALGRAMQDASERGGHFP